MKNNFLKIIVLIIFLSLSMEMNLSLKNIKNSLKSCGTELNCKECREEGQYKKCNNNLCYCCSLDSNKCHYQQ